MSRIQQGSLLKLKRKSGPDVWVLRWYDETGGTRTYRKRTLGNVIRYPHLRDAERAADALRNTINSEFIVPETISELVTHYRENELTEEKKAYATIEANTHYLTNHIVPKWGAMYLHDVRTVDVELWLHSLIFAPGTRSKIRNIMSAVFNHAIRHEWMDRNPISKVRTSAKRLREPDVLSPAEIASLLAELELRERAMVMLAGSTGLRRSELVALTWSDMDLELMQVNVRRSCVRNHFGDTKTEASRKPVPLHPSVVKCLKVWREDSPYRGSDDFIFPSIRRNGKQPLSPDTLLKKIIRPAVERAGIKGKAIGWHSFRHSLATNLRAAGVDLKTAQELLRHANSRITLDVYTRAISATKREANNRVMTMVLEAGKKQALSAPSKGAKGETKKGADRSSTLVSTLKGGS
ncbi:MAG: site-specific integrase [Candidatus Acidiferrales bacterium]